MSFWNLSDNETIDKSGNFEMGGGSMEPIPDNTQLKTVIDEAKWEENEDLGQFISLRHSVLAPDEYKNRKIFQKIKVKDQLSKTSDKAKRMLAAIDVNCGGGLIELEREPTDQDLQKHLLMKPMIIVSRVWELEKDDGSMMSGNWVQSVAPLRQASAPDNTPAPATQDNIGF